jgi:hypothetical protein
MKKKLFPFLVFLSFLIAILCLALWILPRLPEIERSLLERQLNRVSQELFAGSIRVQGVTLNRQLRARITELSGKLQTRQGPVPLEIRFIESLDPLSFFLTKKPVRFIFEGFRPEKSPRTGVSGTFTIDASSASNFEFTADFGSSDLKDWQWLDPQNLSGATGATKGSLTFRQAAGKDPEFQIDIESPQPGGNIQAKFFDLFLPYLPVSAQKEKVRGISQKEQLIRYQKGSLKVDLLQSDRMKILLQIFIPDYNLKLTLNADLRTDRKDAFSQIARIMGLIEVK